MRLALLAALLAAVPAFAWDTGTNAEWNWKSIYAPTHGAGSYVRGTSRGNEHPEISDELFFTISPELQRMFGTDALVTCGDPKTCKQAPVVVDLNASILRPDLFGGQTWQDDGSTVLEERQLPALSMWAGLPDYNYTVYEWINKSQRCAALPLDADRYDLCHVYNAWLGAGLNSTHWGDLAMKVYARHHAIAMRQAQRAAELRALLRDGGRSRQLPPADGWYADYVREAELMSLSYEMVGAHYMQDRWAMGHMFSRWGGGSYEQLKNEAFSRAPTLDQVTAFGTVTGIVHGTIAVFGKPDPLGAPLVNYEVLTDDRAKVMTWRFSRKNAWYPDPVMSTQYGLGDDYYQDVYDDLFDATVKSPEVRPIKPLSSPVPVKAHTQQRALNTCTAEGVRAVIHAFDAQGGKFGDLALQLPAPDPNHTMPHATANGSDPLAGDSGCGDAWATNDSYLTAATGIFGPSWELGDGLINDIVLVINAKTDPRYSPSVWRWAYPLANVVFEAVTNKVRDDLQQRGSAVTRYGVESAKDGMRFFANDSWYRPNGAYGVPDYYEPEDLDSLPWFSEQRETGKESSGGRDRSAIDGFFNKARTESWCSMLYGAEKVNKENALTLKLLREQGFELELRARQGFPEAQKVADRYRAACGYLANRVYKAVDPRYPANGTRFERIGDYLPFDGAGAKFGPTYEPICAYFDGAGGTAIRTADSSDDHKPYFIKPGYVELPGKRGDDGYAPKTLENWCELIPVLEVGKVVGGDADAVGQIDHLDGDRWLKMKGENVGIKTGGGKVGQIIATDAMGSKRSLDIWDGMLAKETGGWSYDNQTVWARIPGSKKGFPTDATSSMTPDQVMKLAPRKYDVELERADDPTAKALYRANGAKSVGRYVVEVNTSWIEHRNLTPGAGSKYKGVWVTHPEWSRDQTEVLHDSVYTVSGGVYTKVDLAAFGVTVEYRDGFEPLFDANGAPYWVAAKDKRGYLFSHPIGLPTSVFGPNGAFFFSFH